MNGARRLSHSISEGDGISILAEVADAVTARAAAAGGAKGLVARAEVELGQTVLPVLAYGPTVDAAVLVGADAVVIRISAGEDDLLALAGVAQSAGIECVFEVRDEDDLERVLEHVDPEILLLSPDPDEPHPVDHILELLPDVPAGKLAIAALTAASREDLEELERAGVDAVLVGGEIEPLVADTLPDV